MTVYIETLRRRIAEAEKLYEAAFERGESEAYLAVAKFDIDQMKAALTRETERKNGTQDD